MYNFLCLVNTIINNNYYLCERIVIMNIVKYLVDKKYREKFQTEYSEEITNKVNEELDERERVIENALHHDEYSHHKL